MPPGLLLCPPAATSMGIELLAWAWGIDLHWEDWESVIKSSMATWLLQSGEMLPDIAGADIAIPITPLWASSFSLWRGDVPSHAHGANEAPRSRGSVRVSVQACGLRDKSTC